MNYLVGLLICTTVLFGCRSEKLETTTKTVTIKKIVSSSKFCTDFICEEENGDRFVIQLSLYNASKVPLEGEKWEVEIDQYKRKWFKDKK